MRKLNIACLSGALCTVVALAQAPAESPNPGNPETTSTSPVAYVYVSSVTASNGSKSDVVAYSAASSGKLTRIPGSPFAADVNSLASNGKYLFGSAISGTSIDAYEIESNGALKYAASSNVPTGSGCSSAGTLSLDHTGASLYNFDYDGNICANNSYQAFEVEKSSGKLSYLDITGASPSLTGPLSFIGNNKFAYTSGCFHSSGGIFVFQRGSGGSLTALNINPPLPANPSASYCPAYAAADPTNHVAIAVMPYIGYLEPGGSYQLATYTAESSGNLTTTSTPANMPKVQATGDTNNSYLTALNMAPSGKLLAVAGSKGLQVFHFNGASPITPYTGLLTSSEVDQIFWDNSNHLYAIGEAAKKLWVFTITPTSHSEAPGSPYTVNAPQSLDIQPLVR